VNLNSIYETSVILPENLLNNPELFYAHSTAEESLHLNRNETLAEHTGRCLKYFQLIRQIKAIDVFFEEIVKEWFSEFSEESIRMFYTMLINTISFHDLGKINPRFQKDRMQNMNFQKEKGDNTTGSQHSLLSAFFYLEMFLNKTNKFPLEERKVLRIFLSIHAYVISKHHGVLKNIQDFINSFREQEEYDHIYDDVKKNYGRFFCDKGEFLEKKKCFRVLKNVTANFPKDKERAISLYAYEKCVYSLLVACDYYATTQFQEDYFTTEFGNVSGLKTMMEKYEVSEVMKQIRAYENGISPSQDNTQRIKEANQMNVLRNELFLESEHSLKQNADRDIFYLEAPTGGGKSNIALNLSMQLLKYNSDLDKIWYIYPFNTLVEQNVKNMAQMFSGEKEILDQIHVVNSITPIGEKLSGSGKVWTEKKEAQEAEFSNQYYVRELLDRQFYHYPITISTHITLFQILFGNTRDSGFGFYQMINSVIILDEIQSYRNDIWTEIITFFKIFAKYLHLKIIIMSATLPDLDLLSKEQTQAVHLIHDSGLYFTHKIFRERTRIHYDLLDQGAENTKEENISVLKEKVMDYYFQHNRILMEFITKKRAEAFYGFLKEKYPDEKIRLMTGDDTSARRAELLQEIEGICEGEAYLLIATQVIEAGVDLKNMDIGFKNISTLDAEEQFMGRINRNGKMTGDVFFFELDEARNIYQGDIRVEKMLTVKEEKIRKVLDTKNFTEFYKEVFARITEKNNSCNLSENIEEFYEKTGKLTLLEIQKRMRLIEDRQQTVSIFFARKVTGKDGEEIDGTSVWKLYKTLLESRNIPYPEWKIKMSRVRARMSYFIYNISCIQSFPYNEKIGDIYYIEDANDYFEEGRLNRKKILNESQIFL